MPKNWKYQKLVPLETKSPLNQFIQIQEMQLKLDNLKKESRETLSQIRSLSQKIPQIIRELTLK